MKKLLKEICKALYWITIGILIYGTYFEDWHFRSQGSGDIIQPKTNMTSASKAEPDPFTFSISDVQEMLNKIEPKSPIKVDGKLGKETQIKWDRVYCNYMALKIDGDKY